MLASVSQLDRATSLNRVEAIQRALASNAENFDNTALDELTQRSIFIQAAIISDGAVTSAPVRSDLERLERDVTWAQHLIPGVPVSRLNAAFIGGGLVVATAAGLFLMRSLGRGKGRRR